MRHIVKFVGSVVAPEIIHNLDKEDTVTLKKEYEVRLVIRGIYCAVTIAEGFVYDGASIPRFLWRVMGHPFTGRTLPAATVHDALYASELMARSDADSVFYAIMKAGKVCLVRRFLYWWAVHRFGGIVWARHTPRGICEARKLVRVLYASEV